MGEDWKKVSCHGNGTFKAKGVFPVELQVYYPAKFQCSALQFGQGSSIYILNIILGRVYDVSVISFAYFTYFSN